MIKFLVLFLSLLFPISLLGNSDYRIKSDISWSMWLNQLRKEAISKGIQPEIFDEAFKEVTTPSRKVFHLEHTQPESRLTFLEYRNTRADKFRIRIGRYEYQKHRHLLDEIGTKYGVNPCVIVSIWGIETNYGAYMGDFPVIQSLATLAYASNRKNFFRSQLFYALEILNGHHIALKDFKGEWAGASGQPQFLPSSWHDYAVDYDGDGRKDIWKSLPDVFASIANYLKKNGWQANQEVAFQVRLSPNFDQRLINQKVSKTIGEWKKLGVITSEKSWPNSQLKSELIRPNGGPNFLIFNNFKVLMKWNRSIYYAGTINWMAEQICRP